MKRTVLAIFFLNLLACSGSKNSDPEKATEVPNKEVVQTDMSPVELLDRSKRLYENALYSTAVESFQSLRDAYSPGPYAEFAEIKMADSNFAMRKFDLAAGNYEEFIKNHPSSKSLPYAMLRAGRSYELSNQGIGRDLGPLEKARVHYEKLIEQYPDSVYSFAGRKYYESIAEKVAEHDEFVIDFYKRRDKEAAVIAREKYFDSNIKPILQKANLVLKENEKELQPEKTVNLETEPPNILDIHRTSSLTVKRKAPAAPIAGINKSESPAKSAEYRIQSVNCSNERGEKIVILLNKEFNNESFLNKHNSIESRDGMLSFNLPNAQSREIEMNCFSESDLKITEKAAFRLKTSNSADLIALINPPRLLLSLE